MLILTVLVHRDLTINAREGHQIVHDRWAASIRSVSRTSQDFRNRRAAPEKALIPPEVVPYVSLAAKQLARFDLVIKFESGLSAL